MRGRGWPVAAGGRGLGVLVRCQEEEDERGDEQRRGGEGDLGLPERRQEEAQRPRQARAHAGRMDPAAECNGKRAATARRRFPIVRLLDQNSKVRVRLWEVGCGAAEGMGREGDWRKACHTASALEHLKVSGARAGSSVRTTSGSGWRRAAERCND